MSNKKLQDAFKQLKKRDVDTFPAEVVSVDKTKGTCVVNDGELEYSDVALSATIEDDVKRLFLFPKVGSFVLVSPINEDIHRLYVEFWSEIEDFDLKIENTELQIDKNGFLLKKENETLKKLFIDALKLFQTAERKSSNGVTLGLIDTQKIEVEKLIERAENLLK